MVVLDASVALAWVLPGESTPESQAILKKLIADEEELVVPAIWPQEVANVIWVNLTRRGRLDAVQAQEAMNILEALDVVIEAPDLGCCFGATFALATRHELTVYDASYLELASRLGCPILTDDPRVIAAAKAANVEVYAA